MATRANKEITLYVYDESNALVGCQRVKWCGAREAAQYLSGDKFADDPMATALDYVKYHANIYGGEEFCPCRGFEIKRAGEGSKAYATFTAKGAEHSFRFDFIVIDRKDAYAWNRANTVCEEVWVVRDGKRKQEFKRHYDASAYITLNAPKSKKGYTVEHFYRESYGVHYRAAGK